MANFSALITPTINFAIFAGIVVYVARKPIRDFFENRSKSIQEAVERVDVKFKAAAAKLGDAEKRISGLEADKQKLRKDADKELQIFEQEYKAEIERKLLRMGKDAEENLQSEKHTKLSEVKRDLLDSLVLQTKEEIRKNDTYRTKITKKMLELIK
ncbi:MAG: hypothetical protein HQK50_18550 [Oligoflexia bacterium]|nr:hypothetical protein [Oligoflexia bacterium]MBF0367582.1 hypothetical protein [Oligoflexia bacterium]